MTENDRPRVVDLRKPRVRKHHNPVGDFELAAANVMARLTGETAILQDDGSKPRMVDIRIEYDDGRPDSYGEVWLDIDQDYAGVTAEAQRRGPIEAPTLQRDWDLRVSGKAILDLFPTTVEPILEHLESTGQTYQFVSSDDELRDSIDPHIIKLFRFGVVGLSSRPKVGEIAQVRVLPHGITGPSVTVWEPVLEWLAELLVSRRLSTHVMKLADTGDGDKHLFIGIGYTSSPEAFIGLSHHESSVPDAPPRLPTGITHVWLATTPMMQRVVAWFPDRGWLDAQRHWANG